MLNIYKWIMFKRADLGFILLKMSARLVFCPNVEFERKGPLAMFICSSHPISGIMVKDTKEMQDEPGATMFPPPPDEDVWSGKRKVG